MLETSPSACGSGPSLKLMIFSPTKKLLIFHVVTKSPQRIKRLAGNPAVFCEAASRLCTTAGCQYPARPFTGHSTRKSSCSLCCTGVPDGDEWREKWLRKHFPSGYGRPSAPTLCTTSSPTCTSPPPRLAGKDLRIPSHAQPTPRPWTKPVSTA
ncbi:hypothetical protein D9M70_582670 [compost metagenome]